MAHDRRIRSNTATACNWPDGAHCWRPSPKEHELVGASDDCCCTVTTAGQVDTINCSQSICYRMRITRYICSTVPASLEPQSERLLSGL